MSITGKQVLLRGVSLAAILEVVDGSAEAAVNAPHTARRRHPFSSPDPSCWLQHNAGRFLSGPGGATNIIPFLMGYWP